MSNKKRGRWQPWFTIKSDRIENRFARLSGSMLESEILKSLSGNAFKLFLYCIYCAKGEKSFEMPRKVYMTFFNSPNVFDRAMKELCEKGFVEVMEHNYNLRQPNKYNFSEKWKNRKK